MIELSAALQLVEKHVPAGTSEAIDLLDSIGRVLAKDLQSDIDSPPFDKSLVDGFAIRSEDFHNGQTQFPVVAQIMAGDVVDRELPAHSAIQIMTGAAIPPAANAVVMVEETNAVDGNVVIGSSQVTSGQNIIARATALRTGDTIAQCGRRISASAVGLLSEIGAARVSVFRQPGVSVVSTGDELVPVDQTPGAGKIRNSNGPMVCALVRQSGGSACQSVAKDNEGDLEAKIRDGLQKDILVLSGGVSAGKLDLVPGVLQRLGVQCVFHKVSLKPGKPVWFGIFDEGQRRCCVFGLPGNPLSSLVCFHLFVRAAIRKLIGFHTAQPNRVQATLETEHHHGGGRPTFWPSRLSIESGQAMVRPLGWRGSADQRAIIDANCLAFFPKGARLHEIGEIVEVLPFADEF